jgi:ribosomal protein S1
MMDSNAWQDAKRRYPVGSSAQGVVQARFDFGVFLELEDVPGVKGFVDLISYRPAGEGGDSSVVLPEVGETVEGTVVSLVERDQQIRIRVGSPFWEG